VRKEQKEGGEEDVRKAEGDEKFPAEAHQLIVAEARK